MPLKLNKKKPAGTAPKNATASVHEEHKSSGNVVHEETSQEAVDTPMSSSTGDAPWCEVGFEASYTQNLGNYNSARAQVSLRVPCLHEEIDQAYEFAQEWVNEKMEKVIASLDEE